MGWEWFDWFWRTASSGHSLRMDGAVERARLEIVAIEMEVSRRDIESSN